MINKQFKLFDEHHITQIKNKAKQVRYLNFHKIQHCQFLAHSFRQLQKIINKKYQYCPTQQFAGDYNIIDEIINRSMVIQPYIKGTLNQQHSQLDNYQLTHMSIMSDIGRVANRQCYQPKIKIDGQLVFQFQNPNMNRIKKDCSSVYQCCKNGSFLLSLQAQPNYYLIYTLNGKNPLLASPNDKRFPGNSHVQNMQAPCTISVVAINHEFCLPSKVLTIIVKKNQTNGNDQHFHKQNEMIRPDFDVDLEQSRSNCSQIFQL